MLDRQDTNLAPSSSAFREVGTHPLASNHNLILRLSKSQQNLDLKLSEIQESLDHLPQIDLLPQKSVLASTTDLNSPLRNLPVELWAQIFLLCLPDQDFIIPSPLQAPLLLCQVCTSWRTIVANTPLLWSNLSIHQSWRRYIQESSLETWLTRSGNAVLQLDISITTNNLDEHIFKLIVSSADRWYHLRISVKDELLRSILNRRMPKLHTLEFSSSYPISSLVIPDAHIPSLKVVSLLTKPLFIQPLSLPWAQLTTLSSLCWLNVEQHIYVLRKCPNLEVYRMSLQISSHFLSDHHTPLVMERLKVLEIVASLGSVMGEFLSQLQLPSLVELAFVVPTESPECWRTRWPNAHVASLIERSSCGLTKLRIHGIEMSEEEMVDAEESIPTLKSIEIL